MGTVFKGLITATMFALSITAYGNVRITAEGSDSILLQTSGRNNRATINSSGLFSILGNALTLGDNTAQDLTINFDDDQASSPGVRWNDTTSKMQFSHDGSSWSNFGTGTGGDAGFDYAFSSIDLNADDDTDTSDWDTGNNATLKGAGAIVGTFSRSTTSAELYDSNNTAVWKYVAGGSDETNDFICSENITIPQSARDNGSGYQDILVRAWYWTNLADGSFDWTVYCTDDAAEISHQADTGNKYTDYDDDDAKDITEGRYMGDGGGISWSVAKTCSSVNVCMQVNSDLTSGEFLLFDQFKVGVLPINVVDTVERMPGLLGSIKWTGTDLGDDSCIWTGSTTGSWTSYGADTDCDDVAATKVGNLVSSDISAGSSDIQKPQIKFSKIPKGVLRCEAKGLLYTSAAGSEDGYRFHDGTTGTTKNTIYNAGAATVNPVNIGEFIYETDQTDVTIEIQYYRNLAGSSSMYARNSLDEDFEISCYWYPLEDAPAKKLVVPTKERTRAGFFGSVKWATTTNCIWRSNNSSLVAFSADADCDDNARTIKGEYNTTNGDAANSDGQLPQIKFSEMPAGTYRVSFNGRYYANATATCGYELSDGTNTYAMGMDYNTTNITAHDLFTTIHYDTNQGATTLQMYVKSDGSTNCDINMTDTLLESERGFDVYYYPDFGENEVALTAFPTVDYSWENVFSARILNPAGTASIASQSSDFIASVNRTGAGVVTVTWKSGFFTQPPHVTGVAVDTDATVWINGDVTTTSASIVTDNMAGTNTDSDFHLIVQRQGDDYRQLGNTAAIISQPTCVAQENTYNSGSVTGSTWTTDALDEISGNCHFATFDDANDQVTLTKGYYCVSSFSSLGCTADSSFRHRLYDTTNSAVLANGSVAYADIGTGSPTDFVPSTSYACFNLTSSAVLELQSYHNGTCSNYSGDTLDGFFSNARMSITKKR